MSSRNFCVSLFSASIIDKYLSIIGFKVSLSLFFATPCIKAILLTSALPTISKVNVSIISFLQGLNIGGKVYNGYSIVTNTKTEEVVNNDSIYIVTSEGQYHRATDTDLVGNNNITRSIF